MNNNAVNVVNETPIYSGLVRTNNLKQLTDKPNGWFIRERLDSETGNMKSFELGIYVNSDTYVSVPAHFNMKEKFTAVNNSDAADPSSHFYVVPGHVKFGVIKRVNKKTGAENALLVSPREGEEKLVFAAAISVKSMILDIKFSEGVSIIRKLMDKNRGFVVFIGFVPAGSDATCVLTEGIPNTVSNITTHTYRFSASGAAEETNVEMSQGDITTNFINFPMWIEKKPVEQVDAPATEERVATDVPTSDDIRNKDDGDRKPYRRNGGNFNKGGNKRDSNYRNYKQNDHSNNRYQSKKMHKNKRNTEY